MVAAFYTEDEEVWKCPKHPSKRRRNGVCPTCLRDRLVSLCPDCANVRPCSCAASCTSSSSSSSSSSYGRVSNILDGEPAFRRSRSLAVPFLRSRNNTKEQTPSATAGAKSFLSVLRRSKTKRDEQTRERDENLFSVNGNRNGINDENVDSNNRIEDFARMITRSRSVSSGTMVTVSGLRRADVTLSAAKGRLLHFPSPMKLFRSGKTPKVTVQDRLPMHRG